ncbi:MULTISPECIES: UPF0175 family protein [unclassified Coleofasciculus]|uniref:UPF0175 family protein n=1 Tax=unclassified Coleofasciculus TaxID=2692782 RepID=UPI002AD403D7|nr:MULTISPECIES: UPF0175 family protein [unclassified Coleofasciculus]
MGAIACDALREQYNDRSKGSISVGKVRELLKMPTRLEVDAFLKAKGIELHYNEADFEADRQTHEQLHS